jgi:hypothetical protein
MPILIAVAVVATIGMTAREISVSHHQRDVAGAAETRLDAVHDPECQDSLTFVTTDSARAGVVDRCIARLVQRNARKTP